MVPPAPESILDSAPPGWVSSSEAARACGYPYPEGAGQTLKRAGVPNALVRGRDGRGRLRLRRYFDPVAAVAALGTDPTARAERLRLERAAGFREAQERRADAWDRAAAVVRAEREVAGREAAEVERRRALRRAECPALERLAALAGVTLAELAEAAGGRRAEAAE
jgi:hypothetical protein